MSGECEACGEHCLDCTCGATISVEKAVQRSSIEVLNHLINVYELKIDGLEKRCQSFDDKMKAHEKRLAELTNILEKKMSIYKGLLTKQITKTENVLDKLENKIREL